MIGFLMVAVLFIYLEWRERVAKGYGGIKTASTSDMWQGQVFYLHTPSAAGPGPGVNTRDRRGPPQLARI